MVWTLAMAKAAAEGEKSTPKSTPESTPRGGHVVVFPFPASGHIVPLIPFARSLASYGVAITFLYPDYEFAKVKALTEDESFDARGNVNLVSFEVPLESRADHASFDVLKSFMYENAGRFGGIVGRLMEESRTIRYPTHCDGGPPVCIVSDMFLGFSQGIAEKFNIQRYCLFASPVHFLSLVLHLPKFNAEGVIPLKMDSDPVRIENFPPIPPVDLPPSQLADKGKPGSHFFLLNEAHQLCKAAGVLVNSVDELEHATIEGVQRYLNEILPSDKAPKILTVGPLVEGLGKGKTSLRQKLRETPREGPGFDWLNQQPDASVLYICFGSVAMLSPAQIHEMAIALERSPHRFFWVLRLPTGSDTVGDTGDDVSGVLPEGFLSRTASKVLVYVHWAPQLHILAHRAVRGFVSHCGWNSTIESLVVGVPIIAWPYQAEQMLNATLLEQLLGVAIRVNASTPGWLGDVVTSDAFERAIRILMSEPAGEAMREKVLRISDVVEKAARPGGSSRTNFEMFVRHVRRLSTTTTQSQH